MNSDDRGYVYDAAWNLTRRTNAQDAVYVDTFTVDSLNQLTNAYTYGYYGNHDATYDANGNLTMMNIDYAAFIDTCFYDDENRLQFLMHSESYQPLNWWDSPQNANDRYTEFKYDGLGRLRQRLEYVADSGGYSWQLASETRYIYDGWRVIQERDGSNVPTVSYTRGADLSGSLEGAGGIGGLLARSHDYSGGNWSTHNFYHADGNGNVTYLVDSSQALAASYRYDPYGNLISSSGSLANDNVYRFSSKMIHVNSGLYYYGFRWYDPNLQRWLNRDPIGELGGLNLYGFTLNNPNTWVDALGLSTICFNVGFDTSAQGTKDNLKKLKHSFNNLSDIMSKCCSKFGVGCGVDVKANYDWNQKPAPKGGKYGNDATVPSIGGGAGCIPILVTTLPIVVDSHGVPTPANGITPPGGIIININDANGSTIFHETGHYGGYDQGNWPNDPAHSKDPSNPMYYGPVGGKDPDKCYCDKVSKLAK